MLRLAQGLSARGHAVHCIFNRKAGDPDAGSGLFADLTSAGIPVDSIPMQRLRKYIGMYRFRRFVAAGQFDVIHTHRFRALHFAVRSLRGLQVPVLLGNKKNSFPVPASWARVYGSQSVSGIIVNAALLRDQLVETGLVDPQKITIIYNGVDLSRFHTGVSGVAIRKEFGIEPSAPLFGMIANLARKKGHNVFFDAAFSVLRRRPDAAFMLIGGGDYRFFRERADNHGFGKNFIFTGYRSDVPELLAAMDFYVLPSRKGEGLTGSLAEAMVMGKPVISTDVAGNADFVKDGDTGLLVPPRDASQLSAAMLRMLDNPDAAEQMGRKARDFICDTVDNEKRTDRFEELYCNLLDGKGKLTQ